MCNLILYYINIVSTTLFLSLFLKGILDLCSLNYLLLKTGISTEGKYIFIFIIYLEFKMHTYIIQNIRLFNYYLYNFIYVFCV